MNAFLHTHPWLLFFVALFVVFTLNAAACALSRAAALGDRRLSVPPASMAGDGAQAPRASSSASAGEAMRSWDIEAELAGMDWWPR